MTLLDHLRPPAASEPGALAYKEWLHCNVFDPVSGCVGLVSLALHGPPGDSRSRAVATALLHVPSSGWAGNLVVHSVDDCVLGLESLALPEAGLFVNPLTGAVDVSAHVPGLTLRFSARPAAHCRMFFG